MRSFCTDPSSFGHLFKDLSSFENLWKIDQKPTNIEQFTRRGWTVPWCSGQISADKCWAGEGSKSIQIFMAFYSQLYGYFFFFIRAGFSMFWTNSNILDNHLPVSLYPATFRANISLIVTFFYGFCLAVVVLLVLNIILTIIDLFRMFYFFSWVKIC